MQAPATVCYFKTFTSYRSGCIAGSWILNTIDYGNPGQYLLKGHKLVKRKLRVYVIFLLPR